jgi:hypothetical protein
MCTGLEIAALVGAAATTATTVNSFMNKPEQPAVVQPGPDQATIDTQAAQEAQGAKLAQQRRARANSLLSSYGGAGDMNATDTTRGQAKPTLGS